MSLVEMNGNASYPISLTPGRSYRVRYYASGMDSALPSSTWSGSRSPTEPRVRSRS